MEQPKLITVDGKAYEINKLSQEIQQAVGIYNLVSADLQKAQLEVVKCQAALSNIADSIANSIRASAAPVEAPEQPANAGE